MQGVSPVRRPPWTSERSAGVVAGNGATLEGSAPPTVATRIPTPRPPSARESVGLIEVEVDVATRVAWRRCLLPTALFLLGFVLATWSIHETTPRNPGREIGLRLTRFREIQDRIDTLFLGSSRVQRGIDPQRFDEWTAKAYVPTRSFNLGVPGLDALDIDLVLRELEEDPPPNLRYVILDPERLQLLRAGSNRLDRRSIAAHEGAALLHLAECARASDQPVGETLRAGWLHVSAAAHQYLNVSRCIPRLRDWIGSAPRRELLEGELGRNGDGFFRAEDFLPPEEARDRRFPAADEERYGAELIELLSAETPEEALPRAEAEFYAGLARRVRALGAVPVFLYSPGPDVRHHLRQLARDGWIANYFDYGDPREHPDFYLKRNRFDRTHLNARGAELFTERLAADFSSWLWNGIQ